MNQKAEIKNIWRIVSASDSSVLELRAIWPNGVDGHKRTVIKHFNAADYADLDERKAAFESEALRLNSSGYNVYVVMNPIKANLSGRAAKDQDIDHRKILLVDIDRAGVAKQPATDDEIMAAAQLGDLVARRMASVGWPEPIRTMSGNGHHLYYVLPALPNDDTSTRKIQQLLRSLAGEFDTDAVRIDTSVFNAARITKVVGTVARKGSESDGRPYRMARVI